MFKFVSLRFIKNNLKFRWNQSGNSEINIENLKFFISIINHFPPKIFHVFFQSRLIRFDFFWIADLIQIFESNPKVNFGFYDSVLQISKLLKAATKLKVLGLQTLGLIVDQKFEFYSIKSDLL